MKIVLTKHAHDMMIERGVRVELIEEAIKRGSKLKQTEGLLAIYQYVRIAYYVENNAYVIKTVMVRK